VGAWVGPPDVVRILVTAETGRIILVMAGGACLEVPERLQAVIAVGPRSARVVQRHHLFPRVAIVTEPLVCMADHAVLLFSLRVQHMCIHVVQGVRSLSQVVSLMTIETEVGIIVTLPAARVVLGRLIFVSVPPVGRMGCLPDLSGVCVARGTTGRRRSVIVARHACVHGGHILLRQSDRLINSTVAVRAAEPSRQVLLVREDNLPPEIPGRADRLRILVADTTAVLLNGIPVTLRAHLV